MRRLALLLLVVGCGSDPTEQPPPDPECGVEQCNGVDDNCDGVVDEGCDCVDGDERRCEGSDVGACFAGISRCADGVWLACEGQIEPVAETCNGIDDDCDGVADGAAANASCGSVAHGAAACLGQCTTVCEVGFDDCNDDLADGCEADLGTSATCGACNVQCAAGDFCEQGSCTSVPALLWSAPFGPNQPYAIDLDATGAMTIGSEIETSLVLDGQTIETTATFSSPTILTARVAATGALDWARVDGPSFRGNFTSSHDGITYLLAAGTGEIDSTSVGPRFAVAFDDEGAALWARTVDLGTGGLKLSVAGPAGVDLTGSNVIHRLDSDGNEVSLRPIPAGDSVYAQLPDGGNLIGGSTSSPLAADCSLLATQTPTHHIARLDADGTCTLILSYELASSSAIAVAPQLGGGFLLVGRGPGTMSIGNSAIDVPERFTMSVDASFNVRWVVPFGGTLETDARGNIYLFELSSPAGSIRSLRPDGVERWTIALDNTAGVFPGTNFNVSPAGHIGLSISTFDLGPLVIGGVELPHSAITVLELEAK